VTPHAPKIAALRAEAAGLLSGDGRKRLLQHVASCAVCAEHLRGARRFHALVSAGAAPSIPPIEGNMAAQRAFARERLARRRATATWVGLSIAAAAAFTIALLVQRPPWAEESEQQSAVPVLVPQATRVPPAGEPLAIAITALSGDVRVQDAKGGERRVAMETPLAEGVALRTGPSARIDLALGRVAGVRLGAETRIELARVRDELVTLRLEAGELSNAVAPRTEAQTYEIEAAGFTVRVRGTLFAVRALADGVEVQCDEGSVEVLGADGVSRGVLRAPAAWRSTGAASQRQVALPNPLVADGAVLVLPKLDSVLGWELGGRVEAAAGELQMRVPRGEAQLTAQLTGGGRHTIPIVIDAVGRRVNPEELKLARDTEEASEGALLPPMAGDASEVIRLGRPALQRCYERSLKNETGGALSMRLSIAIDPRGKVRSVQAKPVAKAGVAEAPSLPRALDGCIRSAVLGWRFPPPGAQGALLEAPLRFQLRTP
jgi:ferric-dicitrate binding protein FerR (iron transport regulator)